MRFIRSFWLPIRRNWLILLLFMLSVVLSIASGWTTMEGMRRFTGDENWYLSLLVTIGIQGIMVATAWMIGETFAKASRASDSAVVGYAKSLGAIFANLPLWIMFLSTMALSVLFSFDALFSSKIFDKDRVRESGKVFARSEVENLTDQLRQLVTKRRNEEHAGLLASSAFADLAKRIDDVADTATKAVPALAKLARDQRLDLLRRRTEEEKRLEGAKGGLSALVVEIDAIRKRLENDRAQHPVAVAKVKSDREQRDRTEGEVNAHKKDMDCELKGLGEDCAKGTSNNSGDGPLYKAAKKKHDDALARLKILQDDLARSERLLDALDKAIAGAEKALKEGEVREQSFNEIVADSQGLLKRLNEALAKTVGSGDTTIQRSVEEMKVGMAEVRKTPDALWFPETKDETFYRKSLKICDSLVIMLQKSGVPSIEERGKALSCAPGEITPRVDEVIRLNQKLDALQKTCGTDISSRLSGLEVEKLANEGRKCVELSGLSGRATESLMQSLSRLEIEFGEKAHPFVVDKNALFLYKEPLAYLALGIAVAVDALVFFTGLIGGRARRRAADEIGTSDQAREAEVLARLNTTIYENDPDDVKMWKTFLAYVRPDAKEVVQTTMLGLSSRAFQYIGYVILDNIKDPEKRQRVQTQLTACAGAFNDVGIHVVEVDLEEGRKEAREYVLRQFYIDRAEDVNHANDLSGNGRHGEGGGNGTRPPKSSQPRDEPSTLRPRTLREQAEERSRRESSDKREA